MGTNILARHVAKGPGVTVLILKEGRFRLDRRNKFVMLRVVKPCPRLPREVVDAPSLEPFQARMDGALSSLVQVKMSLLTARWLDKMIFKVPFQDKPFHDSLIL